MKFYNEYDKKFYDTAAQCEAAEKAYIAEQEKKRNGEATAKAELAALHEELMAVQKKYDETYAALKEINRKYTEKSNVFARTYGYLPKDAQGQQILSWLLNAMP